MSKNFVREINNIKNINKQEFYTNKANDLLSTKEHNYIRKQKREYHCLTDNVKQTKATNVKYTDTTASPNVNYNLISVDNNQVPKTNTNTISASSLVSALEAKDEQLKELKDEIAKLTPEKFEGVINTSSSSYPREKDGFITAKTIKKLDDQSFLVEFNFTGNLEWNEIDKVYKAWFAPSELYECCVNFDTDLLRVEKYMSFDTEIYDNDTTIEFITASGEIGFKSTFGRDEEPIRTTTSFAMKVTYTKNQAPKN